MHKFIIRLGLARFSRRFSTVLEFPWLDECSRKNKLAIHVWVFMTNHVHLLVTPDMENGVSKRMASFYTDHKYRSLGGNWLEKWNEPDADQKRLPYELLTVNATTIGIHLATGELLVVAYWL
jgi:hypothetical protein